MHNTPCDAVVSIDGVTKRRDKCVPPSKGRIPQWICPTVLALYGSSPGGVQNILCDNSQQGNGGNAPTRPER